MESVMVTQRKPTHPGEILREDIIKPLGLTVTEAARHLGVTRKTLSALLNCKTSLSPTMAMRIARATKTSPESWLYMQAKLNLWNASKRSLKVIEFSQSVTA